MLAVHALAQRRGEGGGTADYSREGREGEAYIPIPPVVVVVALTASTKKRKNQISIFT
jgi:hypothetical protein